MISEWWLIYKEYHADDCIYEKRRPTELPKEVDIGN